MMRGVVVLAGGLSSRMGAKKEFLVFRGRALILRPLDVAASLGLPTYLSITANELGYARELVASYEPRVRLRVVQDHEGLARRLGRSPVVAIYSVFKRANEDYLLVLSGDSPLINASIASSMLDLCVKGRYSAVAPVLPSGRVDPVHTVYNRVEALEVLDYVVRDSGRTPNSLHEVINSLRKVRFLEGVHFLVADADTRQEFKVLERLSNGRAW